jgi:hypothetical protein
MTSYRFCDHCDPLISALRGFLQFFDLHGVASAALAQIRASKVSVDICTMMILLFWIVRAQKKVRPLAKRGQRA